MKWSVFGQYLNAILATVLMIRLLSLRVYSVYRVFCAFLAFEIFQSVVFIFEWLGRNQQFLQFLDYRITWIGMRVIAWILTLATVYALLSAVLKTLPGILRLSRMVLNAAFLSALFLNLLTVRSEYLASTPSQYAASLDKAVLGALVLERAVSMSAFFVFLAVLAFILWFPVQIPRNLAVLSVGFVVYFGAKTSILLVKTYLAPFPSDEVRLIVGRLITLVLASCFIYWAAFLTKRGEVATVRIGHGWQREEQTRLIGQLEAMNAALLRARPTSS